MKEHKNLEFKSFVSKTFLKTVSAFANFCEGQIIFGVSDDGEICGLTDDLNQLCLDIENMINDSIQPKPDFSLAINSKNKTITLTVYEGSYKPYLYNGNSFRRSDTSTVQMDQIELKRLTMESMNLYFDEIKCNDSDLSFDYLQKVLKDKLNVNEITQDILKTLGFYTKENCFNNAASLLSDNNLFYGVDIARFGKDINEILERVTLTQKSILEQFDKSLKIYTSNYKFERIEGSSRNQYEKIPEVAFREALANALVHRTWDVNACIRISMFDDYIQIDSPGGLPKGITKDEYLRGSVSCIRNPILASVFYRLSIIEMFGTGVKRIQDSYKKFKSKPSFEIFENSIRIILPVTSKNYIATDDQMQLLDSLNPGHMQSSTQIAKLVGWSRDKTIRILNQLVDKRYIQKVGLARAVRYYKN